MKNIYQAIEEGKFSYEELKKKSIISLLDDKEYLINIIIGFKERGEFHQPIIDSFTKAFKDSKDFCLTFMENDTEPKFQKSLEGKVNYLWSQGNIPGSYNRSFAYNFGVKYSNKAKFYLLHDVDILVKENFFEELLQNITLGTKCMQTYGKRRVLYLNEKLKDLVLNGELDINTLNENSEGVSLPMFNGVPALGSKGGSILIEKEFYYSIGGFDPEIYFGYSPEDQGMWDKAQTLLGEVECADNPPIDMFHMWHPPTFNTNPLIYEMEGYMNQFRAMTKKERLKYIELKIELFKD